MLKALRRYEGNKSRAAKDLQIDRGTVANLMKRYAISEDEAKGLG